MEVSHHLDSGGMAMAALLIAALIVAIAGFFAPSIVALVRKHPNSFVIILLNLFIGGTGVGWVVALVWALQPIRKPPTEPALDENLAVLGRMKQLLDEGDLSQPEYEAMKQQYVAAAA